MNHFDEAAWLLYLDGQLESSRRQELAAHLEACAECRELLGALEKESRLLTAALTEENESMPARLLTTPGARGWSWAWAAAFAAFAAGAYWLWSNTVDPWLAQITNAGFGGTDLASLLLFSGAFWEGWSDMIDILQIAVPIVMGVVALGLLRRHWKRTAAVAIVLFALGLGLGLAQPASAAEVRHDRQGVIIPASETVHNDLIVSGPSVHIEGTVEGDVIAFTGMLTVTGHVTGDIIAFAGQVRMAGTVDGNMRIFSNTAIVEGSVGKNMTALANTFELSSRSRVGGSLISLNSQTTLEGQVQRDLLGLARRVDIEGTLGGNTWVRSGDLLIGPSAVIDGPITYQGSGQPQISAGAKLASPIHIEAAPPVTRFRVTAFQRVVHEVVSYGAALILGLLVLVILPRFFQVTLRETSHVGLSFGVGALALLIGFFVAILGILLIFVGVGAGIAATLLYPPILYVARIFVGAWLGIKILGAALLEVTGTMIGRLALGLLILYAIGLIPVLGGLSWLAVALWGTGAVLLGFYRLSRAEPAVAFPAV